MSNKKVIEEFLTQMATQDNRCTAFPIYYVIRTEVEEPAPVENCDYTRYYDPEMDGNTYDSIADARDCLEKDGYDPEDVDAIIDRLEEYGVRNRWERKGMFLTEDDAKQHLELNYYHYSHNAHTYVEHAWRAPKLNKFFEALFDEYGIKLDPGKK